MRIPIAMAAIEPAGRGPGPGDAAERDVDPSALAVVPTLDAPIPEGKSAVWCASFQVAWNRLAEDVVKGPPQIRGAEEPCRRLNGASVGEADLPDGTFYAAAGWAKDGICERIRKEMAAAFPSAPQPNISGAGGVAYAYLEAGAKFEIPSLKYMKKRGGGKPFFALWVDGADILDPWKG
jgi:hypothetical protein